VIDAAGNIYVIGGDSSSGRVKDVWVSADGGADRTQSRVLEGALGGYHGYYGAYHGGTGWILRGTSGALHGYWRGIKVYQGVPRRTKGGF
jgi:hypothetical protein